MKFHVVKPRDTLWGISNKYNLTVKELALINNLSGRQIHNLQIGQKIYLESRLIDGSKYDTQIKIILLDLAYKPILKATIQLEFDGRKITKIVDNGIIDNIMIEDHSKGLKVYYKNLKGSFDLIAHHKSLPLGKKILRLTSRKMKVEGKHYASEGVTQYSISGVLGELKRIGKPLIDGVEDALNKVATTYEDIISDTKISKSIPLEKNEQKRTDKGNSTHIIASQFTEDNFLLKPVNNKYRAFIVRAAKRHGFTPHALAAVIDAEAAKIKSTGEWNINSKANSSSAAGLTQFLDATWLAMCSNQNSLVGQYVLKNPKLSKEQKLNLRFNPEMAIDAAAAYAIVNFKASKLSYENLKEPSAMAKFAYLLHHEGATGGRNFVLNTLSEERAEKLLYTQFGKNGKTQAANYLKRFKNAKDAYGAWLRSYIDGHINIYQYVVDRSETSGVNLSMDDTIKLLKGEEGAMPTSKSSVEQLKNTQEKSENKSTTEAPQIQKKNESLSAGGANGWHNPLISCKLRTAKLANAKSATFGKVRDNGKKNHQGVDLEANPGTSIYAVCSGVIVAAHDTGGAYGKAIVLRVDIDDLSEKQKKYAKLKLTESKHVYFFYAHLSVIDVDKDDLVETGEKIGKTGATGNASNMTTISSGAHLHFEARSAPSLGRGLVGRIDPIPFITTHLPY